jgi:hypothetical protein
MKVRNIKITIKSAAETLNEVKDVVALCLLSGVLAACGSGGGTQPSDTLQAVSWTISTIAINVVDGEVCS